MQRWRFADATCAFASASEKWSVQQVGRSRSLHRMSWRRFGHKPSRSSAPGTTLTERIESVEKIAKSSDKIEIRSCQGFDELEACVRLQIETWGYDESDVIPRKTFLVAQSIGGQVIGAFDSSISGGGAKS